MTQFVRFQVDSPSRFESLQRVFAAIKTVKNFDFSDDISKPAESDIKYNIDRIRELMPNEVIKNFVWPSPDELTDHRLDPARPLRVSATGSLRGANWSLVRILDLIDSCEYSLDRCELVDEHTGELHIATWAYPYGGLNALIALIEGFGFNVVGVDERGEYEPFFDRR